MTGYKKALSNFTSLLRLLPHDPHTLRELAQLHAQLGQPSEATSLFLSSFNFHKTRYPDPRLITDQEPPEGEERLEIFSLDDLIMLVDLLRLENKFKQAINVIKSGQRWLQGRMAQTSWDRLVGSDDREFDLERKWREGWDDGGDENRGVMALEESGVWGMENELRLRLGICRLMIGDLAEAKVRRDIFVLLAICTAADEHRSPASL